MLFMCLALTYTLNAQVTTSTIRGKVKDKKNNEGLPGALIKAVHMPSGTVYQTLTQLDGSYTIPNLRPGGPYTISADFISFKRDSIAGAYISLSTEFRKDFILSDAGVDIEAFEVIYDKNDPFNGDKDAGSTNIGIEAINNTPTLNRSLQDVTATAANANQSSFGGGNYRFNNLNIDGASNNDALGFQEPASGAGGSVASGTPGALAGTQPISLDAIDEVQVAVAPFDIRQGNFTGASINAVTRSGTNTVEGSIYSFARNHLLTGKSVDDSRTPIDAYHDVTAGFRLGAPIKKNKAFVFINYEHGNRMEPVLFPAGDPGSNISVEVAQAISDTLVNRFGYDPGGYGATDIMRTNNKFFIRFDVNLSDKHQLVIRDNLVVASADRLERAGNLLKYESQGFTHNSLTNSIVGELRSTLNNTVSNHLILGLNNVEDDRTFSGEVFPHVDINYNTSNKIQLGTYREASIYGLSMKTYQLNDNLNIYKQKHTFTIGTANDIYDIEYRFLTAWNGRWEYRSLDDFYANQPNRIRGVYNKENNEFGFNKETPSADINVMLLSAYVQDKYEVNDYLKLTAGVRLDYHRLNTPVPVNQEVVNTPEFAHFTYEFGAQPQINPRVSFHYLHGDKKNLQVRGGTGLFSGRIPFAWYAYAHYISGNNYGNIDLRPDSAQPIVQDLSQLQSVQPGLTEINLVDNDFKLPRIWRSSMAIDIKPAKDWLITIEGTYGKAITDIQFKSINLKDSVNTFEGADNREYYSATSKKVNENFTNVFVLSNTNKGFRYNVGISINRKIKDRFDGRISYNYGVSKDIANGVRSSMAANFNWNQAVNSNDPALSWSNFDLRHKVVTVLTYNFISTDKHKFKVTGIGYAQSGNPYSYVVAGDVNNDSGNKNDLVYVPRDASEIQFLAYQDDDQRIVTAEEQWADFNEFIENDPYLSTRRGQYAERNGARTPWNYRADIRADYMMLLNKEKGTSLEITFDLMNVLNLINRKWGWQYYVPNITNTSYFLLDYEGALNNQPIYTFHKPSSDPWQVDGLLSRWQGQLGLRYNF